METLGTAILSFAAIFAGAAVLFGVTAARGPGRLRAAHFSLHTASLLLVAAVAALAYAFLSHDLSLRYVVDYSDSRTSLAYLLAGTWAGQNGSLLLWAACVAVAGSIFLAWRHRSGASAPGEGWPAALAGLFVLAMVFIVLAFSNPFQPILRSHPVDGVGLNGLLRNPLMAVHPPVLFAAYALTVVPAVLAASALIRGEGSAAWIREARPYALAAWGFLSLGNLLGMLWAYEELGWGGYWGWDPVENASLFPWLVSTAYLHVAAVAERRGLLRRTAVVLVFLTAILPLFGTYLTRSGIVASQHAFAESPASGSFLVLLCVLTASGAALLVWRWRSLGDKESYIESPFSREAGALVTAILFVLITVAMTAATMAPLLGRVFGDDAVQIEPSGYVRFMAPAGLAVLFLTSVCPLLAYRWTSGKRFLSVIGLPALAAAATLIAQLAAGDEAGFPAWIGDRLNWFALSTFPLAAFVIVAALSDLARGVLVRSRAAKEDVATAAAWLVRSGRRRMGSDLVHVGAALMFAGFAGASYQQTAEGMLQPSTRAGAEGSSLKIGGWRLTYLGARDVTGSEYDETQALVQIDAPDGTSSLATPSLREYHSGSVRNTAEVAIITGVVEDFYLEVRQFLGGSSGASPAFLRVHVNPLTWFVWAGSLVLFAGTLVALWPSRRREQGTEWGRGLRRARSFALLSLIFVALVAAFESAAQGALVAAGALLVAALWAGAQAVRAATAGGATGRGDGGGEGGGGGSGGASDRVDGEIEVEKMMGRWGEG
ncbi:MAG: cytochrome c biogenesis protein CcsA [Deltaproteobacteria bacterium]|nr:cytochrome c biogenesis protein CcsA [Deltaproteobacteria bacterium]